MRKQLGPIAEKKFHVLKEGVPSYVKWLTDSPMVEADVEKLNDVNKWEYAPAYLAELSDFCRESGDTVAIEEVFLLRQSA